jgi:copper chaperone CopZ
VVSACPFRGARRGGRFSLEHGVRSCWQIRQELTEKANGAKPNGWLVACAECTMFDGVMSCWEQGSGSPCCCAPVHVTCDFCALYIEHRREITDLLHAGLIPVQASPERPHTESLTGSLDHRQGGMPRMEKLQFNLPDMWADHHVLKVREVLGAMDGVQDVVASSAFRVVMLSYDPAVTGAGDIWAALEDAGYSVATDGAGVIAEGIPVADGQRDPAWVRLGMRQTRTDERDLKTKR